MRAPPKRTAPAPSGPPRPSQPGTTVPSGPARTGPVSKAPASAAPSWTTPSIAMPSRTAAVRGECGPGEQQTRYCTNEREFAKHDLVLRLEASTNHLTRSRRPRVEARPDRHTAPMVAKPRHHQRFLPFASRSQRGNETKFHSRKSRSDDVRFGSCAIGRSIREHRPMPTVITDPASQVGGRRPRLVTSRGAVVDRGHAVERDAAWVLAPREAETPPADCRWQRASARD
jgi:hypothetical protein